MERLLMGTYNKQTKITYLYRIIHLRLNTDFICWRGSLTKLLATPYDKQDDWAFGVIFHKNNWYIGEIETEKREYERLNQSQLIKNFTYWGLKFETYVTAGTFNFNYF
jgi:RAT1-interacting protein